MTTLPVAHVLRGLAVLLRSASCAKSDQPPDTFRDFDAAWFFLMWTLERLAAELEDAGTTLTVVK